MKEILKIAPDKSYTAGCFKEKVFNKLLIDADLSKKKGGEKMGCERFLEIAGKQGSREFNKFYLEGALLAFSEGPTKDLKKAQLLNTILNMAVKDEVKYNVYNDTIKLSKESFEMLFGSRID